MYYNLKIFNILFFIPEYRSFYKFKVEILISYRFYWHKTAVLLLLSHCSLLLPLLFFVCYVHIVLSFFSSFAVISLRIRGAVALL